MDTSRTAKRVVWFVARVAAAAGATAALSSLVDAGQFDIDSVLIVVSLAAPVGVIATAARTLLEQP